MTVPVAFAQMLRPSGGYFLSQKSPYKAEYLVGFKAQSYEVPVQQGWAQAKQKIDKGIEAAVRQDIGGDAQRIHSVSSQYHQRTFKHILLPVWMLGYRYPGKTYQVMVNGETGKVLGERPFSTWKVALAVTLASLTTLSILYMQTR